MSTRWAEHGPLQPWRRLSIVRRAVSLCTRGEKSPGSGRPRSWPVLYRVTRLSRCRPESLNRWHIPDSSRTKAQRWPSTSSEKPINTAFSCVRSSLLILARKFRLDLAGHLGGLSRHLVLHNSRASQPLAVVGHFANPLQRCANRPIASPLARSSQHPARYRRPLF